jgi:UDP-galactopyranose mutase
VVLERRNQLGGNVHDSVHSSGYRFHTFGPHYFRTSSARIWKFVNRFAAFYPYEARIMAVVDGAFEHWPVTRRYIERHSDGDLAPAEPNPAAPANFEEAILAKMPRVVYGRFVAGYTRKQWDLAPAALSADLAKRVVVREGEDTRLTSHRHQGLPRDGYTAFMTRMLDGIRCFTGVDYLKARADFVARDRLIYTGAIDEYYGCDHGRLRYRSQRREHVHLPGKLRYPCAQINFPDMAEPRIRVIEWAHLLPPGDRPEGTLLTYETPYTPSGHDDIEYPFPSAADAKLYQTYRRRSESDTGVLFCGRLGEYRYYDMDQVIGRALRIADRLLHGGEARELPLPSHDHDVVNE